MPPRESGNRLTLAPNFPTGDSEKLVALLNKVVDKRRKLWMRASRSRGEGLISVDSGSV